MSPALHGPTGATRHLHGDIIVGLDPEQRRSTTRYIILFNGGLQGVIALSTCEAEYIALSASLSTHYPHIACLLPPRSILGGDNRVTVDSVNNPVQALCAH